MDDKLDVCPLLGQLGVIYAMRSQAPRGLHLAARRLHLLKPPEEHSPNIAIARRQSAATRQMFHPRPWQSKLHRPTSAYAARIVQMAIDMHCRSKPGKIPVEKRPSWTARMRPPPKVLWFAIEVARE